MGFTIKPMHIRCVLSSHINCFWVQTSNFTEIGSIFRSLHSAHHIIPQFQIPNSRFPAVSRLRRCSIISHYASRIEPLRYFKSIVNSFQETQDDHGRLFIPYKKYYSNISLQKRTRTDSMYLNSESLENVHSESCLVIVQRPRNNRLWTMHPRQEYCKTTDLLNDCRSNGMKWAVQTTRQ